MYDEKKFKRTIVLTKVRRYIFIFLFVILGLVGAYVLSEFLTEIARLSQNIATAVMVITGITIFLIGIILTSNLSFKIEQAYLEIKLMKKLNLVSFKLDKLLEKQGISISDEISKEMQIANDELMQRKKNKKLFSKK